MRRHDEREFGIRNVVSCDLARWYSFHRMKSHKVARKQAVFSAIHQMVAGKSLGVLVNRDFLSGTHVNPEFSPEKVIFGRENP